MSKKKEFTGTKRISQRGHYVTVAYEKGKKIGSARWHGSNTKALAQIVQRKHKSIQRATPQAPRPERVRIFEVEAPRGSNILYNELVYYVREITGKAGKARNSNVYVEVRLQDVVLPADVGPENIIERVRPLLNELCQEGASDINIGSSGGYPTSLPTTHSVFYYASKKNALSNHEWFKSSGRVNL